MRLKHVYYIKFVSAVKNDKGEIIEIHCTYDPDSRGGDTADKRKVKGTLHWISAKHSIDAQVRLYDRLFVNENPDSAVEGKDFRDNLNPKALEPLAGCKVEPWLKNSKPGNKLQFLRHGYFCVDKDSTPGNLVFNRTVTLKDTWAKIQVKQNVKKGAPIL